ncbi:hypothetical protein BAUCODRAFT_39700 [Baudoinia panamericana UAMH 10762]|uniref:Uncharacterized protein n=1 Tax=Baudoinia panamericana (strain UAMH 10762) TaxID=717646 RepID=M2M4K4_BAUPA|nr:uncharacterized protein BAUCODRAFT_39700 [Baudoinia panamericana UAMH 10762]EMC91516.1 hypothetical protein BAUCODRAFT_39700 [Baudoinia panamericana UAMH 10762]
MRDALENTPQRANIIAERQRIADYSAEVESLRREAETLELRELQREWLARTQLERLREELRQTQ